MIEVESKRISWEEYFSEADRVYELIWKKPFVLDASRTKQKEPVNPVQLLGNTFQQGEFVRPAPAESPNPTINVQPPESVSVSQRLAELRDFGKDDAEIEKQYATLMEGLESLRKERTVGGEDALKKYAFWHEYAKNVSAQFNGQLQSCLELKQIASKTVTELALLCLALRQVLHGIAKAEQVLHGDVKLVGAPTLEELAVESKLGFLGEILMHATIASDESNKAFRAQAGTNQLATIRAILDGKTHDDGHEKTIMKQLCMVILSRVLEPGSPLKKAVESIKRQFNV